MQTYGGVVIDLSDVYYAAMDEITHQLKNQDMPRVPVTDSYGNLPVDIFVYWVARELESMHCMTSTLCYRSGFSYEDIVIERLDGTLKEDLGRSILQSSVSSLLFPDTVKLKIIGPGYVAAIRN